MNRILDNIRAILGIKVANCVNKCKSKNNSCPPKKGIECAVYMHIEYRLCNGTMCNFVHVRRNCLK